MLFARSFLLRERAYARPGGRLARMLLAPQGFFPAPPGEVELGMAEMVLRAVGEVFR